tara:strand:- start:69 stop:665 length:597 start_codon:yes stop_codon:yes gene_type:complete
MAILILGEFLFGLGDAMLIAADIGNTPWTVLAQGISLQVDLTVGQATLLVSAAVLLLWIPIKEIPGMGTILNAIIIAVTIDLTVPLIPQSESYAVSLLQVFTGILLIAIGSSMYLTANLGPGPRDGWMTGIQRVSGIPIGRVRISIEVSVLIIGIFLGGKFGIGTILFAIAIGPVVASCLAIAGRIGSQNRAKLNSKQ